jgi:hypothetical protein
VWSRRCRRRREVLRAVNPGRASWRKPTINS